MGGRGASSGVTGGGSGSRRGIRGGAPESDESLRRSVLSAEHVSRMSSASLRASISRLESDDGPLRQSERRVRALNIGIKAQTSNARSSRGYRSAYSASSRLSEYRKERTSLNKDIKKMRQNSLSMKKELSQRGE